MESGDKPGSCVPRLCWSTSLAGSRLRDGWGRSWTQRQQVRGWTGTAVGHFSNTHSSTPAVPF